MPDYGRCMRWRTSDRLGFEIHGEPLRPKLTKLNPIAGVEKAYFRLKSLVELVKSIIKILIIGGIAYGLIKASNGGLSPIDAAEKLAKYLFLSRRLHLKSFFLSAWH